MLTANNGENYIIVFIGYNSTQFYILRGTYERFENIHMSSLQENVVKSSNPHLETLPYRNLSMSSK